MAKTKELNETPICEGNPFELFDAAREKFVELSRERSAYKEAYKHLLKMIDEKGLSDGQRQVLLMLKKEIAAFTEE